MSKRGNDHSAVLAALRKGKTIQEAANAVGVSRQTFHAWLSAKKIPPTGIFKVVERFPHHASQLFPKSD